VLKSKVNYQSETEGIRLCTTFQEGFDQVGALVLSVSNMIYLGRNMATDIRTPYLYVFSMAYAHKNILLLE